MKKFLLITIILFALGNNKSKAGLVWASPNIYSADCFQWGDQLVVPFYSYFRTGLQNAMTQGNTYQIIVQNMWNNTVYDSCWATYTGNTLWNDEAYMGFLNIQEDIPIEEQEELMGNDYFDEEPGYNGGLPICIQATFVLNFQLSNTSLLQFQILIYDHTDQ